MFISTSMAIKLALRPGDAEALGTYANNKGYLALSGIAKGVKYARNGLYISVALTVIAAIGAGLAATGAVLQYSCAIVATCGVGLAIMYAKRLYDITALFIASVPPRAPS